MPSNQFAIEPETRPLTLFAVAVTGVLASALLGASTNAINGVGQSTLLHHDHALARRH